MSRELKKSLVIFLAAGISLLAISYFVATSTEAPSTDRLFWSDVASDAAIVLLTVALVTLLWDVLGGDPISKSVVELRSSVFLLLDSKETGIERVNPVSSERHYGDTNWWTTRLRGARGNVDLMGYTLRVWTRGTDFREELLGLVRHGVHVRLLIMDEENSNLRGLVNESQVPAYSVEATLVDIRGMSELFSSIVDELGAQDVPGSLVFRKCADGMITAQICRIDDKMTVIPYQFSVATSQSPIFEIRGSESRLFKSYQREFDMLWDLNENSPSLLE